MTPDETERREAVEALFDLMLKLWRGEADPTSVETQDYLRRDLVCTPCGGHYGDVAYWVLVVNGSPPEGVIVVYVGEEHLDANWRATYLRTDGKPRALAPELTKIVREFVRQCLPERAIDKARPVTVTADGMTRPTGEQKEIARLQSLVSSLTARCEAQSELLSRRAEGKIAGGHPSGDKPS